MINRFTDAFKNNFYLSKEYLNFCENVTGLKNNKTHNFNIINNKNISINNYTKNEMEFMTKNKINFLSVSNFNNSTNSFSSILEYPILFHKPYEESYKRFDRSFRKYIKKAENIGYKTVIIRKYNQKIVEQIYELYVEQMKRLNGFLLPKTFFESFLNLHSSLLLLIYYDSEVVGYSCCFENANNLYTSIGGGSKKYFDKYINYKLYHEKIKYACKNKLNIHMGIGIKDSGYNIFKKRTGAICFTCERFPNNDKQIQKAMPFLKFKIVGLIFRIISKIAPKKVVFILMPFT